jgi:[ribosomal protein S5]-alanine N-acetyltransferase
MRVIEAAGLRLEPQVAAHADAMFAVLSDPAIYEHENAPPVSVDALRERYRKLETRRSGDGREQWLNWVVRLPEGELAGYVQATVYPDRHGDGLRTADVAYEFASRHWGRGLAHTAVKAMIGELAARYDVRRLCAILKRTNERSRRFLERQGFALASAERHRQRNVDADELLMERSVSPARLEIDVFGTKSLRQGD